MFYAFLDTQTIVMTNKTSLQAVIAGNLRAEMAAQNLSVSDLSTCLSIRYQPALDRKNGKVALTPNEIELLALWLGISEQDLLLRNKRVAA